MYFRRIKGLVCLTLFSVLALLSGVASAKPDAAAQLNVTNLLTAKPASCVTLRQGRTCFAKVSMTWQTTTQGDYCLMQKTNNRLIRCWKNSRGSQINFDFESTEKVAYQLVAVSNEQVIAEAEINVSWVHKASPRKRRWRLF